MTTKRTTTVTHPDGTISTRTSKTRTYSHAVVITPTTPTDYAFHLTVQAVTESVTANRFRLAAATPSVTIRDRGLRLAGANELCSHRATLEGTDGRIYTYCSADGRTVDTSPDVTPVVALTAYLIAYARRAADDHDEADERLRASAAEVLAAGTPGGRFRVLRWSSSAALATKALKEFEYFRDRGHGVHVVEVDA
jgi:hypothetical protein